MWYLKRTLEDIRANRFVNAVTVIAVCLAVFIVSAALLFFANADDLLRSWQQQTRLMAYLKPGTDGRVALLQKAIAALAEVEEVRFIPAEEALRELKSHMPHQASLFENLTENPLPDAFEIRLKPEALGWEETQAVAARVSELPAVAEVEYGRQWVETAQDVVRLFQTAALVVIALFGAAAAAIVANTTRLVAYSRREEVEIMRLVGAAEGFIRAPFYIASLLQGMVGAAVGLAILFAVHSALAARLAQSALAAVIRLQFLSAEQMALVALASVLVSLAGCYLSLKQFLTS